jgi:hypothetical protein
MRRWPTAALERLAIRAQKCYIRRMQINVNTYPQLKALCWNRADDAVVDGEEALGLYENNWRMVEPEKFDAREQELLDQLVAQYGNGFFMPA